jgi:hypothetical protein
MAKTPAAPDNTRRNLLRRAVTVHLGRRHLMIEQDRVVYPFDTRPSKYKI